MLNEFLVERDLSDEFYNFRCENSFASIRSAGFKAGGTDVAHTVRPPQRANAMVSLCINEAIFQQKESQNFPL